VGLTSTLEANNETQAVDMPLHRSACTLGGETAGTWGSLKHGWHVVVDTTLFWRDRDGKEQLLTAPRQLLSVAAPTPVRRWTFLLFITYKLCYNMNVELVGVGSDNQCPL
jgi:hypothetical protein